MSKPEDIPQGIMNQAHMVWQRANTDGSVFTADGQGSKYIPAIDRAIMAAKAEEREACIASIERLRKEAWRMTEEQSALEHAMDAIRSRP